VVGLNGLRLLRRKAWEKADEVARPAQRGATERHPMAETAR
jgi:hypothetical protein